jgi:carotenoid cleavage dioxygenase-like enzyme
MGGGLHPLWREAVVDRRAVLRAALATGLLGAAGCAGSGRGATSATTVPPSLTVPVTRTPTTIATTIATTMVAPTTTVSTGAPLPDDPSLPYWARGNFAPVDAEIEAFDLPVTGALPPELDGLYVRNGSNPKGASAHWFLGDGMVHGVRLGDGRAEWYRNRWVQTPLLGRGDILGSGADVGAPGGPVNSSNTSVVAVGGRLLSLQEVGFPYEVSRADLATVGPVDFAGTLASAFTAHPKVDPATGLVHAFGYGFVPPYLTYVVVDPVTWRVVHAQEVPVPASTMIHDFAITDRDVVFWDLPVVFDIELALAGEMPFVWDPSHGSRVGVMPLGGGGTRWVDVPSCYVFHGTNAWREGDDVVVDLSVQRTMFKPGGDEGSAGLQRWRIATGGSALRFGSEVVVDRPIDLPTIDRRRTGRSHRYGYYVPTREEGDDVVFGGIVRVDARTGATSEWVPGPDEAGAEPLFVPRPGGTADDDGWVLAFVFSRSQGTSDLAVFDAADVARGPVARVHLPQRVPFGFHGCWLPSS